MIIYKITNLLNGKIYVGKTARLSVRMRAHFNGQDRTRSAIDMAISKYGKENFSVVVLEDGVMDEATLNSRETHWIRVLRARDKAVGYNLTDGGEGSLGRKHTQTAIAKMSAAAKGRIQSESSNMKRSAALRGRIFTDEHRKKISNNRRGVRPQVTAAMRKPKTEAHKAAMRDAFRSRKSTRLITFNNETHPVAEWARRIGITKEGLKYRLDSGWPIDKAMEAKSP